MTESNTILTLIPFLLVQRVSFNDWNNCTKGAIISGLDIIGRTLDLNNENAAPCIYRS